jgi:Zn-dependent alcohol dehydrogenase
VRAGAGDVAHRHGGYAELVAADVRMLAAKPAALSWEQAAALPLAGLTAYRAVVHALQVREGDTVLIHGAAGGVGSLAAQIALARGATVIGSDAQATAMAPHPPLGWSHHTTYDHLVSVDGDEASIDTQFITFDVVGASKPEDGWPAGTFGAQGTIKPIEFGYYRFSFRRTGGAWLIRVLDVIHDIPFVF